MQTILLLLLLTGQFWIWNGGDGVTLNNAGWGTPNGSAVSDNDRLLYNGQLLLICFLLVQVVV